MTTWDVFHSERLEIERGLATDAIRAALAAGRLRDDDLVRPTGSNIPWTAIADVAELVSATTTAKMPVEPEVKAPPEVKSAAKSEKPPAPAVEVQSSEPPESKGSTDFDPTHQAAEFSISDFVDESDSDFEETAPDAFDDEIEVLDALDILEEDGAPVLTPQGGLTPVDDDLAVLDESDLIEVDDAEEKPFDPHTLFEVDDEDDDQDLDHEAVAAESESDELEDVAKQLTADAPSLELDIEPDLADMPAGAFDLRPARLDAVIDDDEGAGDDDEVYFVAVPEPLPGDFEEEDPFEEDEDAAEFTLARGKAETVEELDLAAMVDVAFQLVLFFLVTATTVLYKSLEIPRPNADAPNPGAVQGQSRSLEDLKDDFILVEIDASGGVKIDRENVAASMNALVENLRAARERTNRKSMLLSADFSTPHKNAVMAYDAASEIGLGIAIANPTPPPANTPPATPSPPARPTASGG